MEGMKAVDTVMDAEDSLEQGRGEGKSIGKGSRTERGVTLVGHRAVCYLLMVTCTVLSAGLV